MEVSDNWDDFISKFNKSIQSQADIKKISVGIKSSPKYTIPERDEDSEPSLFSDSDFS